MEDSRLPETCYRTLYDGMVTRDIRKLNEVLDASFVLIHMTGLRQSKEEFLRAVEDGTLRYFSADPESIEVFPDGDRADLRGRSRVRAAVFGGGPGVWRLQLDLTLLRAGGVWRICGARASTY